ncbi:MAG: Tfp pilus assembly protein FimT/FimU [Candidatus Methylacidiphilales bacterium]|nr:type II secretion system protein [Candidatus Methylacidiphilales bacterium]
MKFQNKNSPKGFTLIELLSVITIIAAITAMSVPRLFSSSNKVNQTAMELAGLLEQARQCAVAQNTNVWVAFNTQTVNNVDRLTVAVVTSRDGTDPDTYGTVPSSAFSLACKVRVFEQFQLKDAGAFTAAQVTSLPLTPTTGPANALSSNTVFDIYIPGSSTPVAFTKSIRFSPSGKAQNSSSPIDVVEFSLQPARSSTSADADNVVVMRVNGLTGLSHVYRR